MSHVATGLALFIGGLLLMALGLQTAKHDAVTDGYFSFQGALYIVTPAKPVAEPRP